MNLTTMWIRRLALALALLVPAPVGAQHFPSDEDLNLMLRYLVEDGETPGIVLGIVEADGSTRVLSYGAAGPDTRPLGARSVFEIGSITKTFTGTLLADMAVRGEVSLSDPVSIYLPDSVTVPSRGDREITLVDLATHHSALPRLPDNHQPADPANPYADYTVAKLYAFLSDHRLRREPGSEYEYSNLGMGLLGHALARAAGTTYRELVRERVLEPLGMRMTGFGAAGASADWMTKGHDEDGDVVPYWYGTEAMRGAGASLRSNIEDMLTYLKANMGLYDAGLAQAMRMAHERRRRVDEGAAIGLGWQVLEPEGRRLIVHGGSTAGFTSRMGFDPQKRVGFVLLVNTGDFGDDIGSDFLRRGPPLALPVTDVAEEVLRAYVGTYTTAPGRLIAVRLEDDGALTMQAFGNVRFRMYAESDTTFFLKRTPWRLAFTRHGSGEVGGLVLSIDGEERTARRISDVAALEVALSADDIARYEGTYIVDVGRRTLELRVLGRDGHLMGRFPGEDPTRLRYQGEHVFLPEADGEMRVVFTIEGGRAESVTLRRDGRVMRGDRRR